MKKELRKDIVSLIICLVILFVIFVIGMLLKIKVVNNGDFYGLPVSTTSYLPTITGPGLPEDYGSNDTQIYHKNGFSLVYPKDFVVEEGTLQGAPLYYYVSFVGTKQYEGKDMEVDIYDANGDPWKDILKMSTPVGMKKIGENTFQVFNDGASQRHPSPQVYVIQKGNSIYRFFPNSADAIDLSSLSFD